MTDESNLIALVDVHYEGESARAACLTALKWDDAVALDEWTVEVPHVAEYRPGFFFERELPCILAVLELTPKEPGVIVVDGYVVLDEHGRRGLGAHLFGFLPYVPESITSVADWHSPAAPEDALAEPLT